MKKLTILMFSLLIVLSACGTAEQSKSSGDQPKSDQQKTENKENAESKESAKNEENAESKESAKNEENAESKESAKNEENTESKKSAESKDIITKEGSFAGLADSHTVAVNIDGKETPIQVGTELQEKVATIKEGQKVTIKYSKGEHGVLNLESIETK
ncbi:hypothetical protein [Bacillus changyiensis]|uniref:hypothetical protein n=1 Tax=Bacillus changyiensis TaxID=3004103 RepID=UPI0022E05BA6|nr:hypothetical protein [Bacillus changyiensis]MDA1476584.1 hypothetical protein [Bacillus changyiensis]